MTRQEADDRLAYLRERQAILARLRQLNAMIRHLEQCKLTQELSCQILPFQSAAKN